MSNSIHEWIQQGAVSKEIAERNGWTELVRCKNCKFSGLPYYDTLKCSKDGKVHRENWFCADGEQAGS